MQYIPTYSNILQYIFTLKCVAIYRCVGITFMALLLSVGICCYLLKLIMQTVQRDCYMLEYVAIYWNYSPISLALSNMICCWYLLIYVGIIFSLLLFVAICCYLLKLFYYRHPNIDGQSKNGLESH